MERRPCCNWNHYGIGGLSKNRKTVIFAKWKCYVGIIKKQTHLTLRSFHKFARWRRSLECKRWWTGFDALNVSGQVVLYRIYGIHISERSQSDWFVDTMGNDWPPWKVTKSPVLLSGWVDVFGIIVKLFSVISMMCSTSFRTLQRDYGV